MSADDPKEFNFHEALLEISRRGHGSFVLRAASSLESSLADIIQSHMPHLSNSMREKLFTGYGPFSSFSTKIDVAFAFGDITADTRHDFHVLRRIRNEFAHPKTAVHFDIDEMTELLKQFKNYDSKADRLVFFNKKLDDLWDAISDRHKTVALVNALAAYRPSAPQASPEKSE